MKSRGRRSREQSQANSRRLGPGPRRRSLLVRPVSASSLSVATLAVATLTAAALVGGLTAAAPASADQAVVTATVYAGSAGGVSYPEASANTLSGCPSYSGPSTIYLYAAGQPAGQGAPQQLALSSTWTLATVLGCGLGVPVTDVTAVQVATNNRGFESPLSNAQLIDPGQYQDPQAPGALPVIFADGAEDQNTYVRPWLGAPDGNAGDEVVGQGTPIRLAVFEKGQPLTVRITDSTVSDSKSTVKKRFTPVVSDPAGASIPASGLRYSWSFGDSATATGATPTHAFVPGTYPVTLQVADPASGTGGVQTIEVTANVSAAHGKHTRSGASRHHRSGAPTGPSHSSGSHSSGSHPGGAAGSGKGANAHTASSHDASAGNGGASGQSSTSTSASAAHRSSGAGNAAARSHRPPPARQPTHTPAGATPTTRVNGRVISDVKPVSARAALAIVSSPASSAGAPAVRQATTASSSSSVVASALVVLVLLGLGAGSELRSRVAWRRPRLGN